MIIRKSGKPDWRAREPGIQRHSHVGLDSGSLLRSFRNDKILLLAQNSPSVIAGLDPAIHSDHQHLPHFIMDRRIESGDDLMRFIAISSRSLPIFDCQTAIRTCALVSAPALFSRVRTFVSPSNFFCANGISARRVRRGPERRFGRNGSSGASPTVERRRLGGAPARISLRGSRKPIRSAILRSGAVLPGTRTLRSTAVRRLTETHREPSLRED
jgi:hypothetical protein